MSGWPGGFPPEIDHLHPPADQMPERLELPVDENGRLFVSAEWVGWIDNVLKMNRELKAENADLRMRAAPGERTEIETKEPHQ